MESWSAEVVERAIVNCAGILDYSELRLKGGMSQSTCPSKALIFGPRNQSLLTTSC